MDVDVRSELDAASFRQVNDLIGRASAAGGQSALSAPKARALARAGSPDHDFRAVLARTDRGGRLVGYAQLNRSSGTFRASGLELVIDPDAHDPALRIAHSLLRAILGEARRLGIGPVRFWAPFADSDTDDLAEANGLRRDRDVIQMRRSIPVERSGEIVPTRPFRPGMDEAAWLATNNRAFAAHSEQGHWDLATLLEREREPWFDPDGLRLYEEDGRLVGSCWTKIHRDSDPPMGEIYVIAVDPDFHGRGLGRSLTMAGLDWLARAGLSVGMLYVDDNNTAAVSLYRSLGFTEHHVDRAYVGDAQRP